MKFQKEQMNLQVIILYRAMLVEQEQHTLCNVKTAYLFLENFILEMEVLFWLKLKTMFYVHVY
jgi:hypothetical protein